MSYRPYLIIFHKTVYLTLPHYTWVLEVNLSPSLAWWVISLISWYSTRQFTSHCLTTHGCWRWTFPHHWPGELSPLSHNIPQDSLPHIASLHMGAGGEPFPITGLVSYLPYLIIFHKTVYLTLPHYTWVLEVNLSPSLAWWVISLISWYSTIQFTSQCLTIPGCWRWTFPHRWPGELSPLSHNIPQDSLPHIASLYMGAGGEPFPIAGLVSYLPYLVIFLKTVYLTMPHYTWVLEVNLSPSLAWWVISLIS